MKADAPDVSHKLHLTEVIKQKAMGRCTADSAFWVNEVTMVRTWLPVPHCNGLKHWPFTPKQTQL